MMMRNRVVAGVCAGAALCASSTVAGPITPPPGPVAGTPGPEPRIAINAENSPGDADSVYRIVSPGSYYLDRNVIGANGKHGIEIVSSNVTLDLNGFAVVGVTGSLDGIATSGLRRHLSIRNGTVSGWASDGINLLTGGAGSNAIVEGVISATNGAMGIRVGENSIVRSCVSQGNGSTGINAGASVVIEDCVSRGNTGDGFSLTGLDAALSGCIARENSGSGVFSSFSARLANCTLSQNGGGGAFLGDGAMLTDCTVRANSSDGITIGARGMIRDCVVDGSGDDGIVTGIACQVRDCTSSSNGGDGVQPVGGGTSVLGCSFDGNGTSSEGAGVRITSGNDNRIEGNSSNNNDIGFYITTFGNIIIRNSCTDNTEDFDVLGQSGLGTIILASDLSLSSSNTFANVRY